ncbi:hypothetical protein [Archangium violaceum]|uniref:hypothetical protein n=1 Tax=Archangium violaceum TaxID=83451 RepID=UPI0036DE2617
MDVADEWKAIRTLTANTINHTKAWGLRSAYTRSQTRIQMKTGVHSGDALAIGCPWRSLDPKMTPYEVMTKVLMAREPNEALISAFRKDVLTFVECTLGWLFSRDVHYQGLHSLHEYLNTLIHEEWGFAMFIPIYSVSDAAAEEIYTGKLGKYGKKTVPSQSILQEPDWIVFDNKTVGNALALKKHGMHGLELWTQKHYDFVRTRLAPVVYERLIGLVLKHA